MRSRSFIFAGMLVLLAGTRAGADTLPLPDGLIALHSADGAALLFEAEARDDYMPLSLHFVTQDNPAYCGPATIAMVLNALEVPRPPSERTLGLGLFDQENIFTAAAEAAKPREAVMKEGMTLDELGSVLAAHGLEVEVTHAGDVDLATFRDRAVAEIGSDGAFVLVNYLRSEIGQEKGGHISPLAAYDADSDRFLILDVSRYKYPPVWVEAAELFAAMDTIDSSNGDRSRGYVVVGG